MRKLGAAIAIALMLATSACGGSGSDRPSTDQISKAIQKSGAALGTSGANLTKKQADCIAKAVVDSKVSDKTLQAMVDGKKGYKPSKADEKAMTSAMGDLVKCATK